MMALAQDLSQNRPAEAREHVRRFHELFFSLSPRRMPSSTISTVPRNWRTRAPITTMWILPKGYYNRLISGNINQVVHVDSVVCDFAAYPYKARTYARQLIIRESNVTERSLVTPARSEYRGVRMTIPTGSSSSSLPCWRIRT